MPSYCVNTQAQSGSGDHEVHDLASTKGCLPSPANRRDLGWHSDCHGAVAAAKRIYSDVNGCYYGCYYCVPACHTS